MLICTYLVAIAGYLFPIKMPQKFWQLFSVAAHPPHSPAQRCLAAQPEERAAPARPALGVQPQLQQRAAGTPGRRRGGAGGGSWGLANGAQEEEN